MTRTPAIRRTLLPSAIVTLLALLAALLVVVLPGDGADAAPKAAKQHVGTSIHGHGAAVLPRTAAQQVFHDQMRKLWEDHVTWTRLAIVTFADGSPSFDATAKRLLANQTDIGDAITPYFGEQAGQQLTALLNDHITIAVELLQAAKASDTPAFDDAHRRWHENANDIADFLSAANPNYWPADAMRDAMNGHLEQTLAEASHELGGDYAASVADYDEIHAHILGMADLLSSGIIGAFPKQFR
jgi:hypothetical protein